MFSILNIRILNIGHWGFMSMLELWGINYDQIENRDYDFVFHLLCKILICLKTKE